MKMKMYISTNNNNLLSNTKHEGWKKDVENILTKGKCLKHQRKKKKVRKEYKIKIILSLIYYPSCKYNCKIYIFCI